MATETKKVTAKQLALRISKELDEDISAKQLRVWLRNQEQGVGQGKRYSFTEKQAGKLQEEYIEYREGLDDEDEE